MTVRIVSALLLGSALGLNGQAEVPEASERRVKEVQQDLRDGAWTATRRAFYHYDDQGRLIERRWQAINRDRWEDVMRHLRDYAAEELVKLVIQSRSGGEWRTVTTHEFLIDDAGATIGRRETRFAEDGTPGEEILWEYTLSDRDRVVDEVGTVQREDHAEPVARTERRFNGEGLPVEQRFPVWEDGAWRPARRMLLEYNGSGHHTRSLRQEWSDGDWHNTLNYILTVDTQGNRRSELWQRWTEGVWEDFRRLTYEYEVVESAVRP